MPTFIVSVPATTGNLGAGFDCLGAALDLYNHFSFSLGGQFQITTSGVYGCCIVRNQNNLIYSSLVKFFEFINRPVPEVELHIEAHIPLARGLGSSATAIVGGIVGGNLLAGSPCSQKQLLDLAIALEGHPDNVVAAMLGGCQLSATKIDGGWESCAIGWHPSIAIALAIPDFELSTAKARAVLPSSVSMADAIFNASHLAFLTQALAQGNPDWLKLALQDRLHQPYRTELIPGFKAVEAAAIAQGAYGMVISGAGPTLLCLGHLDRIQAIAMGMVQAWGAMDIKATRKVITLSSRGIVCTLN